MSFLHLKTRFSGIRLLTLGALMSVALTGSVLAAFPTPTPTPPPTPTPKPKLRVRVDTRPFRADAALDAIFDNHSPAHPANLIQDSATDRIVERLREVKSSGATAGAESKDSKESKEVAPPQSLFGNYSVYGEYSYLHSNDMRSLDMNSITNSGTGGFDMTIDKTLVGLIYSFSHASGSSDFLKANSSSDSNFVSIFAAQPVTDFLAVGLTAGYGHTDVTVSLRDPFFRVGSDSDAWTASPFFSLSYAHNNFYTSLTTTFQYLHTDADDSCQLNFLVNAGYHFTDWLSGEINGKFTQSLHNTRDGFPEDDDWFSVGAKLKQNITTKFSVYEQYQYNVNQSFSQHMMTGGLSYSF